MRRWKAYISYADMTSITYDFETSGNWTEIKAEDKKEIEKLCKFKPLHTVTYEEKTYDTSSSYT